MNIGKNMSHIHVASLDEQHHTIKRLSNDGLIKNDNTKSLGK